MAILDRSDEMEAFLLSAEFDRNLEGTMWAQPGMATVWLEWEVVSLGQGFDGIPDGASDAQPVTGSKLAFEELVNGLDPSRPYTWRARFATDNPLFPSTPWFTVQATAPTETKFRTRGPVLRPGSRRR